MTTNTTNWMGGIPGGTIGFYNGAYVVRFKDKERKSFNPKKYKNAEKLATEYRIKRSLEKGLTKNQYRIIESKDDSEKYCEIKLQDDYIAKIDYNDLELLGNYSWSAKVTTDGRIYMHRSERKGLKYTMFHRLIYPESKCVDHINRDGLDNRRKNLRDLTVKQNNENQKKRKDNKSNKTGVHYSNYDKTWVAQWMEGPKRKTKSFSVSKYNYDGAKLLAINHRQKMDIKSKTTNGYGSDEEVETVVPINIDKVTVNARKLRTNTSGVTNVSYNRNGYWVRAWRVNGKKKTKSFSVKKLGDAKAKQEAIKFVPPV